MLVILTVLLCVHIVSGSNVFAPSQLKKGTRHRFTAKAGGDAVFCYTGTGNTSEPSYLFSEVLIHVNESDSKRIPWFSIKGASTDDLQTHIEDFVVSTASRVGLNISRELTSLHEVDSYLRVAVSSCPNPLLSASRSECVMRFSTVGQACVKISTKKDPLHFVVFVEEKTNYNFIYSFLLGTLAFFVAGHLGHSMVFQYTAGAIVFIFGGVLAVLLLVLKYIARAGSGRNKWMRNLTIALLLSASYFTLALWYLREYWHILVLRHVRYVLYYIAVMGVLGAVAVQIQRNDARDRKRLTVAVKWIIRAIAIVVLYNSTASPFGSLTLVSLTVLLYVTYVIYMPRTVLPVTGGNDTGTATAEEGTMTDESVAADAPSNNNNSDDGGDGDAAARASGRKKGKSTGKAKTESKKAK